MESKSDDLRSLMSGDMNEDEVDEDEDLQQAEEHPDVPKIDRHELGRPVPQDAPRGPIHFLFRHSGLGGDPPPRRPVDDHGEP